MYIGRLKSVTVSLNGVWSPHTEYKYLAIPNVCWLNFGAGESSLTFNTITRDKEWTIKFMCPKLL